MKSRLNKILSVFLVAVMLVTAAPLSGFVGLDINLDWLDFTTKASAETYSGTCGDNLTWTFDELTGELIISGTGEMNNFFAPTPWVDYCDKIQSIIIEENVTTIGDWAFAECQNFTSVTIPDSVISIGEFSFSNCKSLTNIMLPESVSFIGFRAFSYCDGLTSIMVDADNPEFSSDEYGVLYNKSKTNLIQYPIGNERSIFTIPYGVTSVCEGSFYYSNLSNITIPNSVAVIEDYAFASCYNLTNVTIPDSVTTIGEGAFWDCDGLIGVTLSDELITIQNATFSCCDNLKNVTFGNKVFSIGEFAFSGCSGLLNIIIPDSVTIIGDWAFDCCSDLTSVVIGNQVTTIGNYAFNSCSLTNIVIPDSVTTIGDGAFAYCSYLESVSVGSGVKNIGEEAFYYCESLTDIVIPDGVQKIEALAFASCSNLSSVTIGKSITYIGSSAFFDCNSLSEICYNGSESDWKKVTIDTDNDALEEVIFLSSDDITEPDIGTDDNITWDVYGDELVISGSGKMRDDYSPWAGYESVVTKLTIEDGVKSIGSFAFYDFYNLESISIPDSVTSIGSDAFYGTGYYNDDSNWKNDVLYIGNHLIEAKDSLSGSYVIEDETKCIAESAFVSCELLTYVIIPYSVEGIGYRSFYNCNKLTGIVVDSANEAYSNDGYGALFNKDKTEIIQYPAGNTKTSYIIPDSVTTIGDWAFENCTNLTSVTIPDSVTTIGNSAFFYCTSLTSVTIPDSVTVMGDDAFSCCEKLKSVKLSENIQRIGFSTFGDCSSLTSITIPDGVKFIEAYAFCNCYNLEVVTIPDSVIRIGDSAFFQCKIKSIVIPHSVKSIGYNVFDNCFYLTNITVDASNTAYSNDSEGVLFNKDKTEIIKYPEGKTKTSYAVPSGVTTIGTHVFYNTSLSSISIPGSVTSISSVSFRACSNLKSLTVSSDNSAYSNDSHGVLFNKDKTELIYYPQGSTKTSYTIPGSVTSIGGEAFSGCYSLTSVTIPNSVTTIGEWAFSGCGSLIGITIPDSVTTIGESAFRYTGYYDNSANWDNGVLFIGNNLIEAKESVSGVYVIKEGVKCIADAAFSSCNELSRIIVDSANTSFSNDTNGVLFNKDKTKLILYPQGSTKTNYTIPDSVTTIGNYAFSNCTNLTSVTIPDSVTTIGECAFDWCDSLTSVTIPDNVTTIGAYAFFSCVSLTNITIPHGITRIEKSTFAGTNITSIEIPDSVTAIGDYVFWGCYNLKSVSLPISVQSVGNYAFGECLSLEKLKVYNRNCVFGRGGLENSAISLSFVATVYGYEGSTAEKLAYEMGYDFKLIPDDDHEHVYSDCSDLECNICGFSNPQVGHTFKPIVSNPTCQSAGSVVNYCTVCKYAYLEKITDPVDHDMSWVVVSKPTSSADGEMHYKCSYCDLVEQTKVVPAFMIASNSIANINFETNTISGFDAGATSIDGYISVENDDYAFVCDSDVIATGTVIELTDGEVVVEEFTAVVFGDVNGDGWYDGTDSIIVSCLANGMLSKDDVSPAFYEAADCNHDGVIDSFDVALLEQAGLLLSNVDQSKSAEELATDEAYIEYLDLIDQTPEEEPEDEIIETPEEQPGTESFNLFDFIVDIIKKFVELVLSRIPVPYK